MEQETQEKAKLSRLDTWRQETKEAILAAIWLVTIGALFSGPIVLGYQMFQWLKTGIWTPLSAKDGLIWLEWGLPASSWGGVQQILEFLLQTPLSLTLVLLAGLVIWVWFVAMDEMEKPKRVDL